jgi:SAM-dependent MidA family methyltransferase
MYYVASIIYSSLGNRSKKGDFQAACELDRTFGEKLNDFVQRLFESKINILMNFADLIKNPVQSLTN